MKVILTKDVPGLGRAGDVRDVSDGYARNFLLLKRLALPATSQMLGKIQKEEQERQGKFEKIKSQSQALKQKLEAKIFVIKAKANKSKLFAAVHEKEIAEALKTQAGVEVEPKQITISQPIKLVGPASVEVRLFEEIKAKINLDIQPT